MNATCKHCRSEFEAKYESQLFCSAACRNRAIAASRKIEPERLHRIYTGMKKRCATPTASGYENYGARGISVCSEWLSGFEVFRDWALANGYRKDLEIDRVDVNGNYEPLNCRWVNRSVNARNTRKRKDAILPLPKGVSFDRRSGKFGASIQVDRKKVWLGTFATAKEAGDVYQAACDRAVERELSAVG